MRRPVVGIVLAVSLVASSSSAVAQVTAAGPSDLWNRFPVTQAPERASASDPDPPLGVEAAPDPATPPPGGGRSAILLAVVGAGALALVGAGSIPALRRRRRRAAITARVVAPEPLALEAPRKMSTEEVARLWPVELLVGERRAGGRRTSSLPTGGELTATPNGRARPTPVAIDEPARDDQSPPREGTVARWRFTDREIADALGQAHRDCGEPLTAAAYRRWRHLILSGAGDGRDPRIPSYSTVAGRLGNWSAAVEIARREARRDR